MFTDSWIATSGSDKVVFISQYQDSQTRFVRRLLGAFATKDQRSRDTCNAHEAAVYHNWHNDLCIECAVVLMWFGDYGLSRVVGEELLLGGTVVLGVGDLQVCVQH